MRLNKIRKGLKSVDSDRSFWRKIGLTLAGGIRYRTETEKRDYRNRRFRKYSGDYREFREGKGRSIVPNLSFTGNMLGSMVRGVRERAGGVLLRMSGREGTKAVANQRRRRIFFRTDAEQRESIKAAWLKRLKRERR